MEETIICQSCAMPIGKNEELYGTNANGSKNPDYCIYCFKDGNFTSDISMDEMIDFCAKYMAKDDEALSEESAKELLRGLFPKLKRWAK
ncbi:MAG: zinc ribbon domain-containing protein [Oscillospiraceae bacterium]|nr:zinc ribbon domain-containing protein [Oscillospiraceae bacterium]